MHSGFILFHSNLPKISQHAGEWQLSGMSVHVNKLLLTQCESFLPVRQIMTAGKISKGKKKTKTCSISGEPPNSPGELICAFPTLLDWVLWSWAPQLRSLSCPCAILLHSWLSIPWGHGLGQGTSPTAELVKAAALWSCSNYKMKRVRICPTKLPKENRGKPSREET